MNGYAIDGQVLNFRCKQREGLSFRRRTGEEDSVQDTQWSPPTVPQPFGPYDSLPLVTEKGQINENL